MYVWSSAPIGMVRRAYVPRAAKDAAAPMMMLARRCSRHLIFSSCCALYAVSVRRCPYTVNFELVQLLPSAGKVFCRPTLLIYHW